MEQEFNKIISGHSSKLTTQIFSNEKYQQILNTILGASENAKMKPHEKNWFKRYTLRMENGVNRLYREEKLVVIDNELFDILHSTHIKLGCGGRDLMWKELSNKYSGISKDLIMSFINLCEDCTLKQAKAKKSIVVKPILTNDYNSRCQVDLIDLQARPDQDYRFIMVYQDHLTKYVILNPLTRKTALEVAKHLMKIFSDFGAPRILQSDNGKEFANSVVRELVRLWPETKIVHGKPRHSQSQGSVERCNRDIMDILTIELRQQKTTQWARLLPIVQIKKNRRFHRGIQRSPFQALFGRKLCLGNEDSKMPTNEERGIDDDDGAENQGEFITIDGTEWVTDVDDRFVPLEHENDSAEDDSALEATAENIELQERDESIQIEREGASAAQKKQAEKMLESSNKKFALIEVGTNVRLRVEDVDRSKIDPRNAIGVVLSEEDGFYKIGMKAGRIKQLYSRNQLEPCSTSFISAENVPTNEICFREAAGAETLGGTQGHKHCNCTTKCITKACSCRRNGLLCNSRCHNSNTCSNKIDE